MVAARTSLICLGLAAVAATQPVAEQPAFRSVGLGRFDVHAPPRSRFTETHAGFAETHAVGNGTSIPAGGAIWPTAIFWAFVEVGTPPVSYPAAIDSGSGALDIGAKGCVGCVTGFPNRGYDAAASSSSKPNGFPKNFRNAYQTCDLTDPRITCSITGKLYKESVSMAGFGPVEVEVGAIEQQDTNFDQFKEIDGVVGFSSGGQKDVFSQLVKAGKCANVWALCINEGAKHNGTLTMGGVDPRLSVGGKVDYVPDIGAGGNVVAVSSFQLGDGTPFNPNFSNLAATLDTGTNVLLLPKKIIKLMRENMCADGALAHCEDLWANKCVDLSDAEVAAYPDLKMQLAGNVSAGESGVELFMSSTDYLLRGSPLATSAGQFCLAIRDGGNAAGNGFLIGDTTMRNYYLVFDLAEKRIGWGPVDKNNCGNV